MCVGRDQGEVLLPPHCPSAYKLSSVLPQVTASFPDVLKIFPVSLYNVSKFKYIFLFPHNFYIKGSICSVYTFFFNLVFLGEGLGR